MEENQPELQGEGERCAFTCHDPTYGSLCDVAHRCKYPTGHQLTNSNRSGHYATDFEGHEASATPPPSQREGEKPDYLAAARELLHGYGFSSAPGLAVTDNLAMAIASLVEKAVRATPPAPDARETAIREAATVARDHMTVWQTSHRGYEWTMAASQIEAAILALLTPKENQ